MLKGYLYRGKHRSPTNTGKRAAAIATAAAIPLFASTTHAEAADKPDWGPIIACESGGDPRAKNRSSTASGLFQFVNGTWRSYGGAEFAPTARQATVEQQYTVANRAFRAEGYRPWNASKSCWHGKTKQDTNKSEKKRDKGRGDDEKRQKKVVPLTASVPNGQYTVREGDTLTNIALAHNVPGGWKTLYDNNKQVVERPDRIYPGEKLNV